MKINSNSSKFQKDLWQYLQLYNNVIVDGLITDNQLYYISSESDNLDLANDVLHYIETAYSQDYIVIAYDSDKSEKNRFQLLTGVETMKANFNSKQLAELVDIFKFENLKVNDIKESSSDVDELKQTLQNFEKKSEEDFEESLEIKHDNSGPSLDISKIIYVSNNITGKLPFLFVFTSTSRMAMNSGTISTISEQMTYSAILNLCREDIGDNRAIILVNKANDLPAWLGSETINLDIKTLSIGKPNIEQRKLLVKYFLTLIDKNGQFISSGNYLDYYRQNDVEKFTSDVATITSEFTNGKISFLFDFMSIFSDTIFDKTTKKPLPLDKVLFLFENGANAQNPWDSNDVYDKVKQIEDEINATLAGQEYVAKNIRKNLGTAVTGSRRISNKNAPRAVFFLAGPTGVGKTEATKVIAKTIFGSEDKMKRFDMSEYAQEHTDQRLFGAPPGYVGYDAGGELTNYVAQNPFSLLLFDEIEKAHPKIFDKFLQILSDGRLTDGQGRTVSFENCVIVMTSNAGISVDKFQNNVGGTIVESIDPDLATAYEKANVDYHLADISNLIKLETDKAPITSKINPSIVLKDSKDFYSHFIKYVNCNLEYHFEKKLNRKEIYGRLVDSIIVYNYISQDAMEAIVKNQIEKTNKHYLSTYNLTIDPSKQDELKKFLIDKANNSTTRSLGGRGIIKLIDTFYADAISDTILQLDLKKNGQPVVFSWEETSDNYTKQNKLTFKLK